MAINYATEYKQALAQPFKEGIKSYRLFTEGEQYQFLNAKTIQIPKLSMTGFRNHGRGTALQVADEYSNDWEPKTLSHDRSKYILADVKDIDETNLARSIANLTYVFNTEHKIPEFDARVFSKLYTDYVAGGGEVIEEEITPENFLEYFDEAMLQLDDAEVPAEGRILYLTPKLAKIAKQAEGLTRTIFVGKGGETSINRSVYSLDDVELIKVPASRFKTAYDFDLEDGGFAPADTAKQILGLLIHPKCQVSAHSLEQAMLDAPTAATSGKYAWFERTYWDSFLLSNRINGAKFFVEPEEEIVDPGNGE